MRKGIFLSFTWISPENKILYSLNHISVAVEIAEILHLGILTSFLDHIGEGDGIGQVGLRG